MAGVLRSIILINACLVSSCVAALANREKFLSGVVAPTTPMPPAEAAIRPPHDANLFWTDHPNFRGGNFEVVAEQAAQQGVAGHARLKQTAAALPLLQAFEAQGGGNFDGAAFAGQKAMVRGLPLDLSEFHRNWVPWHLAALFLIVLGLLALTLQLSSGRRGDWECSSQQVLGAVPEEGAWGSSLGRLMMPPSACRGGGGALTLETCGVLQEHGACASDRGS